MRILFTNPDGSLSVVVPTGEVPIEQVASKDVPNGVAYEIVSDSVVPADRTFRNAWKYDPTKKVDIDVPKAKVITHDKRRAKRETELSPLDKQINENIANPAQVNAIEAQRQVIRAKYTAMQASIDACNTPAELKAIIDQNGL